MHYLHATIDHLRHERSKNQMAYQDKCINLRILLQNYVLIGEHHFFPNYFLFDDSDTFHMYQIPVSKIWMWMNLNTMSWRSEEDKQHILHCWLHWREHSASALVWLALAVGSLCYCSTFLYSKPVRNQHKKVNLETLTFQILPVVSLTGCSLKI